MTTTSESIIKRIIENIQSGKYCESDVNDLTNTILRNQICNSLYEQLIQPKVVRNEDEEVNLISIIEASLNYYSLITQYVSSPFKKSGFIESWENRILLYISEKPTRLMMNFSEILDTAISDNDKFIEKLLDNILKNEPDSSDYSSDLINSFDSHFQLYIKAFNSLIVSCCNNRSELFKLLNLELRIFRYVTHYNPKCEDIREFISNHINLMNSLSEQQYQIDKTAKVPIQGNNTSISTNYQVYQVILSVLVILLPLVPDMLEDHTDSILDGIINICNLYNPVDSYDICCICRYIVLTLYAISPIKIHEYLMNNNLSNKLSFILFGNVSFNYQQFDFSFSNTVKSPTNNSNSISLNELRHFIFELSLTPLKLQLNSIYETNNVDKNYTKCINTFNKYIKSFPLIEEYTNKDILPDDLLSIAPPVFNFCNYIGDYDKKNRNENEKHYYEELFNEIQSEHKEYVEILTKKSIEIDNEAKKSRESCKYNQNFNENDEYAKKIQHYQEQIALLNSKLSEYEEINVDKLKDENKCYKEALTQWEVYNKNYIEDSIDSLYNKANSDIEKLELRISELEKQNEILSGTITEMKKYPNKDGEKDNNQEILSLQDQYSKLQFTLDETIEQYESHLDEMRKELELKDKELTQLGSKYGC